MPEPPTTSRLELGSSGRQALDSLSAPDEQADMREVLARAGDLESGEVVDLLVLDQAQRWHQGQRIPVETYLRLWPALRDDGDEAFELVYSEFVLREELGERPTKAEYAWRFPQFAERLRRQAHLFQTLVEAEGPTTAKLPSPPLPGRGAGGEETAFWPRLDDFEIEGELGRGGMAIVYKARQISLGRTVALKLIRDGALADADQRARFRREAEAVARLQHPNIVQIYEIGAQDGLPYLCLEYVAGGSLARHLQGVPQTSRDAAGLVETVARAVHHAHRQGIVHRDLKPANILLATDEHRLTQIQKTQKEEETRSSSSIRIYLCSSVANALPKIADFGLAKRLQTDDATRASGHIVGTAEYMAPEQAQGKAAGPAADVYALGAILYELLAGRPPFRAATPVETLLLAAHDEPAPPRRLQPGVPRDLETICLKCLEKAPPRRYATAEELADDLRRFRAGEPVHARPVRWWGRTAKWARRRPALAALILVTAAGVLGLGVFGVWHTQRLREQKDRADYNLDQATAAIGRLAARADPLGRLGLPELDAARRHILEEAIRSHEGLLAHADNSTPRARLRHSLTHFDLGRFRAILGQWDQARQHFAEALAIQEALAEEFPRDVTCRRHLGVTCGYHALWWEPNAPEREAFLRRGLGLLTEVLQHTPEDRKAQRELARTYHHLGHTYNLRRHQAPTPEAHQALLVREEEAYRRALGLKEALLHEDLTEPDDLYSFTSTTNNLAVTLFSKKELKEADELLLRSARLLEEAAGRGERRPELTALLLGAYINLGSRADVTNQHEEARSWYARVVGLEEALAPRAPRHYRKDFQLGHAGLAKSLTRLQRHAEAVPHWDRALELCEPSARPELRYYRAVSLALAGDHARATAEATALADEAPTDGARLYVLAAMHATSVKAARADARLTTPEREERGQRYAATAVRLLEKARAAGYFKQSAHVQQLEKDDSFAALREHAGFIKFLASLQ